MTDSVDLTDLRSITEGDKEIEQALFDEFYSSTEAHLQILAANCTDGQNETWRSTAHAMKGTAFNIGALMLGELCKKAQDEEDVSGEEKKQQLDLMQKEYVKVKAYLTSLFL